MRGQRMYQSMLYAETAIPALQKPERKGRNEDLMKQRNIKFVHRVAWYRIYHKELNYEAVLERLEDEIDLAKFTLGKMMVQFATDIRQLIMENPPRDYFRKMYPFMVW